MSFAFNSSNQINFNDSVFNLTEREKGFLEKSWAKLFADNIFPNIDEEPFSVLYSDKAADLEKDVLYMKQKQEWI